MYCAFLRVSVLTIAAVLTALLISAISAGSPELKTIATLAADIIQPAGGTAEAAVVATVSPKPTRSYLTVEELPQAGTYDEADLIAPYDSRVPALRFAARQLPPASADEVTFAAFRRLGPEPIQAFALARVPHARPPHVFVAAPDDGTIVTSDALLAYAPPETNIEAPFDALLGQQPRIAEADDGLYRPRPRPNPETVLSWLAGRALGQFAPGQHGWVQNPLPEIVYLPKEQKCLAEGIYFEARGESELGQAAVAQVILNRVRNPAYPKTICGVVYQNKSRRHSCQFSFACDGRPERVAERREWEAAQRIALDVTNGKIWIEEVGDSTHYHARYVRPGWGRRMIKVDRIGAHIFYRTRYGGWS